MLRWKNTQRFPKFQQRGSKTPYHARGEAQPTSGPLYGLPLMISGDA